MSDLISRQKVIDTLCRVCGKRCDKNKFRYDAPPYDQIILCAEHYALTVIPSAQPEQRWIPCSERLPEVHEEGNSFSGIFMQSNPVLVCGIVEGEESAQFNVATYCDDLDGYTYWSTELDALTVNGVTAWMPLPEPYQAERREDG